MIKVAFTKHIPLIGEKTELLKFKKKKGNPFEITETFICKVFLENSSVTQIAKIKRKLEVGECISKTLNDTSLKISEMSASNIFSKNINQFLIKLR